MKTKNGNDERLITCETRMFLTGYYFLPLLAHFVPAQCKVCYVWFSHSSGARKHALSGKCQQPKPSLRCDTCQSVFSTKGNLGRHGKKFHSNKGNSHTILLRIVAPVFILLYLPWRRYYSKNLVIFIINHFHYENN